MKLLFSRNPNPRLAVAVARHVGAPVAFELAAPFAAGQAERYRPLNPTLFLPILVFPGGSLWETDAIACRLSRDAGSVFWRRGDAEPRMIQWLSWGKENFVRACEMVQYERGTRLRYAQGPTDPAKVEEGLGRFATSAALLEAELSQRDWLLEDGLSYADFRMATFLPCNDAARLPLHEYPALQRWYGRLEALAAWRDPFQGLLAPELPPIPA
ncbi:glutathione S-transferase family protein [Pseudoxanthomonas daejeonensis]|uniref:glutathione S-transferase family protein n=1 Tax=Pseudoxanthomonas daejeonensis TaxID=266062 RepID=UPI001F53EEA4|nr:glutathione S-transferase family protein [Pseudoxanthomonas daejeonensis]UNK56219.1 glutathione S-transferase family protein [Pseudoxanthomonas daejeonensis]